MAENANLRKLGWTYRLGTVFAPRQNLYQKEATGMERQEMYFPSPCKNPFYLYRPSNYPSQGSRNRPENENLLKLGLTYCHGTVFAPRQYVYQKEGTGMKRSEIYSSTRCKNHSYLWGLSNYPISRELVYARERKLA